jgi:hypothetical protein
MTLASRAHFALFPGTSCHLELGRRVGNNAKWTIRVMSWGRLDITTNRIMLDVWLREQYSRCVGAMRGSVR